MPGCPSRDRIPKFFKNNLRKVALNMQVFLNGLRSMLEQPSIRFISGRPKKPPNEPQNQPLLFQYA
jgi:hypothetical protein